MRLLEQASDHTSPIVCVNCLEELEPEAPGVLFEQAFVSGSRAGMCEGCFELIRELVPVDVEVVLDPKDESQGEEDDG